MSQTKALTPEQNQRLRELLQKLIVTYGGQTPLATAIGVKQGTLSGFLTNRRGGGGKILGGLMKIAPAQALSIVGAALSPPGDTFAMAKEAVDMLEHEHAIPRGEAWLLLEAVQQQRRPAALEYYVAALAYRENMQTKAISRPTPLPAHDEDLVVHGGGVGVEVPKKDEPKRTPHPRRRTPPKRHKL